MEYMQKYVKEQGDTSLCNVNKNKERSRSSRSKSRSEVTGAARSELSGSKRPSTRPRGGGIREQRPDAALDVLAAGEQHKHGRRSTRLHDRNRLHQTCRPVNQFEHVCVEECPLTTRHTAAAATAAKSRND